MNKNIDPALIDTTDIARAMIEATARRLADTPKFIMPDRPADRSRNGRRSPRSVPRRNHW